MLLLYVVQNEVRTLSEEVANLKNKNKKPMRAVERNLSVSNEFSLHKCFVHCVDICMSVLEAYNSST